MYYLIYGLLYLISLLPFFILYTISDFGFFIVYHVIGYRKEIVLNNLKTAFPEKGDEERKKIAKEFYKNLTDTFIETIKLLSISDKAFDKRVNIDTRECNALVASGKSLQVHSGHQMNWEYAHLAFARNMNVLWVGVYMHINNKHINRIYLKFRSKFNAHMLAARDFSKDIREIYKNQYALALIADQNPGWPKNNYWLNFFNRPAPFMAGAEKGAMRNNTAVVFVNFVKLKRGYYRFEPVVITENAASFENGELTRLYRDFLENSIRKQPSNYLWSHRRWKWEYQPEFKKKWIDNTPPPEK